MSVYIFNILNPFKDNDNITTIMTYFDTNLRFFPKKRWYLKTAKAFYIPSNLLLYIWKHLINQNKNKTWMIIKDWTFYGQNLQSVAILHKNWEFLSSYFFKIFSGVIFHSVVAPYLDTFDTVEYLLKDNRLKTWLKTGVSVVPSKVKFFFCKNFLLLLYIHFWKEKCKKKLGKWRDCFTCENFNRRGLQICWLCWMVCF